MSLFDKVAQVTLTLAFFIGYSRLQLYNKKTLARVPVNFENFLRFLTEHPKTNTFVPFRSLWNFTSAPKEVFLLFYWDSCPCAAKQKRRSRKVEPGTLRLDPPPNLKNNPQLDPNANPNRGKMFHEGHLSGYHFKYIFHKPTFFSHWFLQFASVHVFSFYQYFFSITQLKQ